MNLLCSRGKIVLVIAVLVFGALLIKGHASAGTLNYILDETISGTTPGGYPTALFDDSFGGSNTVRLTMASGGLSETEEVLQWYFNFDPSETASLLTLQYVSGAEAKKIKIHQNDLEADEDENGYFDFAFKFEDDLEGLNSTNSTSVYDITYTSPITASSFEYFSEPDEDGPGLYRSVAQVNGIGVDAKSGWVGVVPEPVSSTLFLVGAATLGFRRFRMKFSK